MFTGIVQQLATLKDIVKNNKGQHLKIQCDENWLKTCKVGDSINVNGVCLSIETMEKNYFTVYCISQTLNNTNLGYLQKEDLLNLEQSVRIQTPLGGHWVLGHIDGLGQVSKIKSLEDKTKEIVIDLPSSLLKYCIDKGCVTINGVSLTLARTTNKNIKVALIPITLKNTNLFQLKIKSYINIEVDILGKYIEKLLPIK